MSYYEPVIHLQKPTLINSLTAGRKPMNTNTQSLELFFIVGKPDGMLIAEVFNWTGHVLMTPRTQLSAAPWCAEARYTRVYLLPGEDDNGMLLHVGTLVIASRATTPKGIGGPP
tara:strand:- start:18853 stop:19194 length:342 start_codon:yes stop_codon:yes gene_type:complete